MLQITDDEVACFRIINFVLKTHKDLSEEDVKFSSNYLCSFFVHNLFTDKKSGFTNEKFLLFLTYTNQVGICKFALTHNKHLDEVIKSRDKVRLKHFLCEFSEKSFVELYDNRFWNRIPKTEKEFVERQLAREYYSMKLALDFVKEKVAEGVLIEILDLRKKCYENICIQDSKTMGCSDTDSIFSKHNCSSERTWTVDGNEKFCFETLELLDAITNPEPINPITQKRFSNYTLDLISRRFPKEIIMMLRYKQK